MSIKDAILNTAPTSYWPLDDLSGAVCQDAMGLHNAAVPAQGVTLAAIPFGAAQAPFFDGALGSFLTIGDDPQYSQPFGDALTVGAWICPLALDNTNTTGTTDRYVHFVEKAVGPSTDVEWALRFYNRAKSTRPSRLSFYTFSLGSPAGEGNGAYMEYVASTNDATPIELGKWIFVIGEAEPWISPSDLTTGCILWKQAVEAKRSPGDKYGTFGVRPEHGAGPITVGGMQTTGFKGAIAHLAIWNRQLSSTDVGAIWTAGLSDLSNTAMYHSYP